MEYPYAFHIALDGNGLNGLEGRAGVCVFRYDPQSGRHEYDVRYYDGMAGGHAVSISPNRRVGFLGSVAQHLMFYDTATLEQVERVSTLRFESTDTSIKGSTHAVWLDDAKVVVAIGEGLWRWDLNRPHEAERLGDHNVDLPHAIKATRSRRYLVYGSMDHPGRGEACMVGIFDMQTGTTRTVKLPTTCWHVAVHPQEDRFYALSFRVQPQGGTDWMEWGIAQFKEYVYEIDAATGQVLRHWSTGQDTAAHINSDFCISDSELVYCNGASGTVVMIDREDFASYRILDARPGLFARLRSGRQALRTFLDSSTRGALVANTHQYLRALRVSRGVMMDSVYGCQLSADQKLLFTANRGLNTIKVYNYPDLTERVSVKLPDLQKYDRTLRWWGDPRLGFHHSTLLSPPKVPAAA